MGGGTYIKTGSGKNTSVIFSLPEDVGSLAEALKIFKVSYFFAKANCYVAWRCLSHCATHLDPVLYLVVENPFSPTYKSCHIFFQTRTTMSTWLILNRDRPKEVKMPTNL